MDDSLTPRCVYMVVFHVQHLKKTTQMQKRASKYYDRKVFDYDEDQSCIPQLPPKFGVRGGGYFLGAKKRR